MHSKKSRGSKCSMAFVKFLTSIVRKACGISFERLYHCEKNIWNGIFTILQALKQGAI